MNIDKKDIEITVEQLELAQECDNEVIKQLSSGDAIERVGNRIAETRGMVKFARWILDGQQSDVDEAKKKGLERFNMAYGIISKYPGLQQSLGLTSELNQEAVNG